MESSISSSPPHPILDLPGHVHRALAMTAASHGDPSDGLAVLALQMAGPQDNPPGA